MNSNNFYQNNTTRKGAGDGDSVKELGFKGGYNKTARLTTYDDFVSYQRGDEIELYRAVSATPLPYKTNKKLHPDPATDTNLELWAIADESYVINTLLAGDVYTFSNVADMLAGLSISGLTVVWAAANAGKSVQWQGYYSPNDGGGNTGVVKTGAHTADGGSIFSLGVSLFVEAHLADKDITTTLFGDKHDNSAQNTVFTACANYCAANNIGVVRVMRDTALDPYTFPRGITFKGRGKKAYGEFTTGNVTTINMLGGAGTWGITLAQITPIMGGLEDIDLQGNWLNNGIDVPDTAREFWMTRVSIKDVDGGIRENDLFKAQLEDVTITCRGVGYYSRGGGTTTELGGVLVQGDKIGGIRCATAYKFDETAKAQPKNSSSIRVGAAQFCVDVFDITGSPKLIIDSFNAEDWTGALFDIHDTYKMKLDIRIPNMIPNNTGAVVFKFSGNIQATSEIWMRSLGGADTVDVTPIYKFMEDGAGLSPNGIFYMEYDLYSRVIGQCDPLSRQMMRIKDYNRHGGSSAILLSGQASYRVPFSQLDTLYSNFFVNDFANDRVTQFSTAWQFGNGLTFRVTSSATGGGAPNVSQLSIRAQAPTAFNKVDLTGTHTITADFGTSELVVTPVSTTQVIVIQPA